MHKNKHNFICFQKITTTNDPSCHYKSLCWSHVTAVDDLFNDVISSFFFHWTKKWRFKMCVCLKVSCYTNWSFCEQWDYNSSAGMLTTHFQIKKTLAAALTINYVWEIDGCGCWADMLVVYSAAWQSNWGTPASSRNVSYTNREVNTKVF